MRQKNIVVYAFPNQNGFYIFFKDTEALLHKNTYKCLSIYMTANEYLDAFYLLRDTNNVIIDFDKESLKYHVALKDLEHSQGNTERYITFHLSIEEFQSTFYCSAFY